MPVGLRAGLLEAASYIPQTADKACDHGAVPVRFECETTLAMPPVEAFDLSLSVAAHLVWLLRRFGRDRLLYVSYPHWAARDPGDLEEPKRLWLKCRDDLAAQIAGEAEATWVMDRSALLRASDAVVISLTQELAAEEAQDSDFISARSAGDYIGYGHKMAVHRPGLV